MGIKRLRAALTYSTVMATVAVFIALGGGAYALSVPRNSVGPKQLKRNAVTAAKLKGGAVNSAKVRDGSLRSRDFAAGAMPIAVGARADDTDPSPVLGSVLRQTTITTTRSGKLYVLASVREPFLTCSAAAPCSSDWGVYVDDKPVQDVGLRLSAGAGESNGVSFQSLFGVTAHEFAPGSHTLKLARTTAGGIDSVGELGSQLGAIALGG